MKTLSLSITIALLAVGCAANRTGAAGSDLGTPRQYQGPPPSELITLEIAVPDGWKRQQLGDYVRAGEIDNRISNDELKAIILVAIVPTKQTSPAESAAVLALQLMLQGAETSKIAVAEDGSQATFTWSVAAQGLGGKVSFRIFPDKKQLMALFMGTWLAASDDKARPAFDAMAASATIK